MPALGAGIHVLFYIKIKDVDGTGTRACTSSALLKCRKSG